MPRIKRWFPVSHDINSDPEIWAMRRQIGEKSLSIWLEFLSIADRNDGLIPGDHEELMRSVAGKCQTSKKRVTLVYHFSVTRMWLQCHPSLRTSNHWKYHRTPEHKPAPSYPDPTEPDLIKIKNKIKIAPNQNFPDEWKWLENMVLAQNSGFPTDRFLDFAWWDAVSYQCGGLSAPFLEKELAGMKRWIMDNPTRTPTPRGYRRFVASWLERAHDKERRFGNAGKR